MSRRSSGVAVSTTGKVRSRHRIPVIERRSAVSYPDRMPAGDGVMTDMPAIGWSRGRRGRARADRPSRPGRNARSRGLEAVTIISAPAGSGKTSLLHAWPGQPGQDHRIALMSVCPGQRGAQLFWLALLGAVRAATGGAESLPAAPEFNGQAMVDKMLSELGVSARPDHR
jgi:LuxR family transcriptional regulator, maltose regulon positive regulatory protein